KQVLDNLFPVIRSYASRYFSRVFATTSAGNSGGGLFLSQVVVSSQLRTNCLSNDGGLTPTRYSATGQKRELSGVSTSSMRIRLPSGKRPHSNLVSAMIMPRPRAYSAARRYTSRLRSRSSRATSAPVIFVI